MHKDEIAGILLVDKPGGVTSHDVVDAVRRKFGFKKVGHAGTLDPMATGLLILLIGKATKRSGEFMSGDKTYETNVVFGVTTDTGDADGKIVEKKERRVSREELNEIIKEFEGEIEQVPPMFSALKHKGKKLYEYARKGIEIKREPRIVHIKSLKVLSLNNNEAALSVNCSKGTYIRQLAMDIGARMGCGAHISCLRRISSGDFSIDKAVNFDRLKQIPKEKINEFIIQC